MKQFLLLVMVLFAGLGFSVKAQTSGDCQMPSGEVVVSNVTATSFELSISDLSAVRWEAGYSVADADTPIIVPVKLGVYSVVIDNLQPETEYVFSARRVCDDGVSEWMVGGSVTTSCAPVSSYPYFDDFEGKEAGFVAQCYEPLDFVGPYSTLYAMFMHDASHSNSGEVMFGAGYGSYTTTPGSVSGGPVGFMKKFHLSSAMAYEVGIYAKKEPSTWNDNSYEVQFVLCSAADVENKTIFGRVPVTEETYGKRVSYLKVAEDGDYYIGVMGYKDAGASFYPLFDDFSVNELTITPPTGINVTNIASTGAKVEFTKVGALTELYVDTVEADVLMGRVFTDAAIAGSDAVLSGLNPMTTYYYAMRSVNPGDTSVYSLTGSFTTSCAPATVPFVEDFEGEAASQWLGECWKQTASSGNYRFAALVGDAYNTTEDGEKGLALIYNNSGSTPSSVSYEQTFAKNVYLEAGKKYELNIDAKKNANSYSDYTFKMKFVYGVDGNVTDFAGEEILVSADTWSTVADYMTVPADGEYYVGVKTYYDGSKSYSPVFDNFGVKEVTCIPPSGVEISNVGATTATVTFTAQGQQTEVLVNDIDNEEVFMSNANVTSPLNLTGLNVHTNYTVKMRTINGNDTSAWTAEKEFETLCMPVDELPYFDDFEGYNAEMLAGCYMIYNSNAYGYKVLSGANYNVTEGGNQGLGLVNNATATSSSSSNGTHAILREFELEAGKNYEVSVMCKFNYSSSASLIDFVALGAGEAFDFENIEPFAEMTVDGTTFEKKRGYFTAPTDGIYTLGIVTRPNGTSWYPVILDDLGVKEVSCLPANITLKSVSDSAAIVEFDVNGNYEVALTSARGTALDVVTVNGQYTIDGLLSNFDYTFRARMICAVGDTSDWSESVMFSTPCFANEVPASEDFSSYSDGDALADACYAPIKVNTTSVIMGVYNGEATMLSSYQMTPDMANGQNGFTDYVHFEAGKSYEIKIDAVSNQGTFDVIISVSRDNDINSANLIASTSNPSSTSYQTNSLEFTAPATENLYVHIYASATSWYKMALDNYTINPLNKIVYNDTVCFGSDYSGHGFNIPADEIEVGENVFDIRPEVPSINGGDTIVELHLYGLNQAIGVVYDYACENHLYTGYDMEDVEILNDTLLITNTQTAFGCDSTTYVVIYYTPAEYASDVLELTLAEAADRFGISEIGDYEVNDTLQNEVGCDSIVTYTLSVVTALDEINMLNVKVVPNPVMAGSTTYVYGDVENAEKVEIINNMGQVVSAFRPTTYPIAIDGASMPGLYFVRITTTEGRVVVDKFVVE